MESSSKTTDSGPERSSGSSRRRTAYACDSCRTRKTRCNGQNPCSTCAALDIDCNYGLEVASTKGKSDLILSAILRVERSISQLEDKISNIPHDLAPLAGHVSASSPQTVVSSSHSAAQSQSHSQSGGRQGISSPRTGTTNDNVDNAVISSSHTSTTESILRWLVFDTFPTLRQVDATTEPSSIFLLENSRLLPPQRSLAHPYARPDEVDRLLIAFQSSINFCYPVVTFNTITRLRDLILTDRLEESTTSCIGLLVMALGCAAEVVSPLLEHDYSDSSSERYIAHVRSLGHVYFDAAMKKIHYAYSAITTESAQCLLLAALYYAYLQRPLQAWSMLNSTATKCRVMLSYGTTGADDMECTRRIFWSCFILESDYLAELSALPHMGIAEMESTVPLPGRFHTHEDPAEDDLSSLYFLACISMRRLLNRCHHLLFDAETGVNLDDKRFPSMVSELDQQLDKWREFLPPAFQFTIDTQPVNSQHGAFLRQRYLTCKALIYRPYLMRALTNESTGVPQDLGIIESCTVCLQACILHIMNLRGFAQTVLVDVWICSLSMSGTMMILLAAYQAPALRDRFGSQLFQVGQHLRTLLSTWMHIPGQDVSPSVRRALEWIIVIDEILREDRQLIEQNRGS